MDTIFSIRQLNRKKFKALVFMEKNKISLNKIKNDLVLLVPHIKIKIFKEDVAKFPSMVDKVIKVSKIKNFYKDKKRKIQFMGIMLMIIDIIDFNYLFLLKHSLIFKFKFL